MIYNLKLQTRTDQRRIKGFVSWVTAEKEISTAHGQGTLHAGSKVVHDRNIPFFIQVPKGQPSMSVTSPENCHGVLVATSHAEETQKRKFPPSGRLVTSLKFSGKQYSLLAKEESPFRSRSTCSRESLSLGLSLAALGQQYYRRYAEYIGYAAIIQNIPGGEGKPLSVNKTSK